MPDAPNPAALAAWKRQHDRAALVRARDTARAIRDPLLHTLPEILSARAEAARLTREIGKGPRGNRRLRRALWRSLPKATRAALTAEMAAAAS